MLKINTIVGRPRPTAADLLQQAYQLQAIAYRLFGGCGRGCAKWSARVIGNWLLILNTHLADIRSGINDTRHQYHHSNLLDKTKQ